MSITAEVVKSLSKEDIAQGWARAEHLQFMRYCWQKQETEPFVIGKHTVAFCEAVDRAIQKFKKGISSYILGEVCFGHGKSEIVSNYLPAHFLGRFPATVTGVISYNSEKVSDFSDFGKKLLASEQYHDLYPEINPDVQNVGTWSLKDQIGKVYFTGIDGTITGRRPNLIILDDYIKGREQAESAGEREKLWDNFTNNIMSRRASVCIVFVLCTPWHKDDIAGRIKERMKTDPGFPQFELMNFPAGDPDNILFPEKYSVQWYTEQRAFLGAYGAAGLMDCAPTMRTGAMFNTEKIHFYDSLDEIPHKNLRFCRAWDLASTIKQVSKNDPDFTAGGRGQVIFIPSAVAHVDMPVLIVDDLIYGQWEAPKRDKIIQGAAIADGEIRIGVEGFAAYKDAFTTLADILKGIRSVEKLNPPGDKKAKADPLTPAFEAGNVWFRRASWNAWLISQLKDFPNGTHDDGVDVLSLLYYMCKSGVIQIF